jgi:hypothetical protein
MCFAWERKVYRALVGKPLEFLGRYLINTLSEEEIKGSTTAEMGRSVYLNGRLELAKRLNFVDDENHDGCTHTKE